MKKDFWKENGILISLYGVVGVLVITAGILTVNSLSMSNSNSIELASEENIQVQSNLVESYREQAEKMQNENNDSNNNEIEKLKESLLEKKDDTKEEDITNSLPKDKNDNEAEKSNEKIEENIKEENNIEENQTSSVYRENQTAVNEESNNSDAELEKINKTLDEEDDDIKSDTGAEKKQQEVEDFKTSKLTWPIIGSLVMEFNDDVLVYDETLNLYRTNDSISIMADKGAEVVASASGKIIEVGSNVEEQGYIVIDHGNGYKTRYSQLVDTFVVSQGDTVRRGQIIGHVGEPSITTMKQGTHLQYRVVQNNSTTDPLLYLE